MKKHLITSLTITIILVFQLHAQLNKCTELSALFRSKGFFVKRDLKLRQFFGDSVPTFVDGLISVTKINEAVFFDIELRETEYKNNKQIASFETFDKTFSLKVKRFDPYKVELVNKELTIYQHKNY